ncbi:MAG: TldD/PmbA family protein [Solirubrobacteraceae bacterium]|nr:MAG: peptidase U62 [Solirubrobacterales bacterium]
MLDQLTNLMDAAIDRCAYADARHVVHDAETVWVRDGRVDRVQRDRSEGVGVRVRVGGAWGFAATSDPSRRAIERALARSLAIAETQPTVVGHPLAPTEPARGSWTGPCELDPFGVTLEDKVELLLAAETAMRGDPRIVRAEASARSALSERTFASTEGAACSQRSHECGAGIGVIALQGNELQVRSYPAAHEGQSAAGGWEIVERLALAQHAPRIADEAVALLAAPACPVGEMTVVLGGEQVALQLHESVGHALELDRMLGSEASYAGTSWVSAADVGSLRYGSELMTVTADATLDGGLGSFAWDDEGVKARRLELIEDGLLRSALSSRETAGEIGESLSGGCMRADGWARQPIVRMTNVSLAPGDAGSLEKLIADTDRGLLLETNRSWSIDDRRLNFQFGCELAREIVDGRLGRLYRNPTYTGVTPHFWRSLDAVCSEPEWRLRGLLNCGKGEPGQIAHVSHGTAPARFREVQVGVASA